MNQSTVFFHEDDYLQIELLPVSELFSTKIEVSKGMDFTEENFTDNGFLKLYSRTETKNSLGKLNITAQDFEKQTKPYCFTYFYEVYTGYSTQSLIRENTVGLGFENYILFYEQTDGIVLNAWIIYKSLSDILNGAPEKLSAALFELGTNFELILVDWNQNQIIDLKNSNSLSTYIEEYL